MRRVLLFGFALLLVPAASAQVPSAPDTIVQDTTIDAAKADSIRSLIRMTRSSQIAEQIFSRVLRMQRQQYPNVPDEWWSKARENADFSGLIDQLVPIYAKHFTHEEINRLLEFYRTPVGRKVIDKMPSIMQESMSLGRMWGKRLRQQLVEQLKSDGYIET